MKSDITKELIINHFSNRITPLQRKQIDEWLQSKANEELYYKWLEEWEIHNPEYMPDSDRLLAQYTELLYSNSNANRGITPQTQFTGSLRRQWWLRGLMAASVLLISGMSYWFFGDLIYFKTYQTAYGEVKTFILTDGSQVTLNANSSLRIPRWGFGKSDRKVLLEGEAAFNVQHTPSHQPFVVKTNKNLEVVVLGTEFSVFSRHRGARVVLKKGKVRVNYQQGNSTRQLLMKPGELVSFDRANKVSLKTASQPQNFSIWKEKRFLFDETILADVAQMLEETYGLTVTIDNPDLAQRKLMGSFRAENVDELLLTIAELLNISIVREEDHVVFSEK
jgi:ferric-dicitrate binding protein FerR (iron transport regulator)